MLEPSATKVENKKDLEQLILQFTQKGGVTTICATGASTDTKAKFAKTAQK